MKRCVLASGPDDTAKLTRNGFIIMCKDRRGQATAEKVRHGKFERKEDCGQCKDCETGLLVEEGKLFHAPDGVEFITIGEMMGKTENIGGLPESEKLKAIPGKNFKNITLSDLKEYWKIPLIKFGVEAICPNCERVVRGHGKGLCGACYYVGSKATGMELIKALADKRKQLQEGEGVAEKLTIPAPGEEDSPAPDNESSFDYRKTQPYKLGQRYREVADILMDENTNIRELAAVAANLGLTVNIEILS